MSLWNSFWDFVWFSFWCFAVIAYLMAFFAVLGDLFRDRALNGWWKAIWIIFLIFVPFLTLLVYLIARGPAMAERSQREAEAAQMATDDYIRNVAGSSSTDEIIKAKALLDAGTVSPEEYEALKARALQPS